MNLTASLILRNELSRYLEPCLGALLEFCDELRVWDNGSTDGWEEALRDAYKGAEGARIVVRRDPAADRQTGSLFVGHAAARQALLDFTLEGEPSHILDVDADEFVSDGAAVRAACADGRYDAWAFCLQEVWAADSDGLKIRQDGGWAEHDVTMLWRPDRIPGPLRIVDRGPATGRTPEAVRRANTGHTCAALLHFGWANRTERQDRYERYAVADAGRYHAKAHLDSILLSDEQIELTGREWPAWPEGRKAAILAHANAGVRGD